MHSLFVCVGMIYEESLKFVSVHSIYVLTIFELLFTYFTLESLWYQVDHSLTIYIIYMRCTCVCTLMCVAYCYTVCVYLYCIALYYECHVIVKLPSYGRCFAEDKPCVRWLV